MSLPCVLVVDDDPTSVTLVGQALHDVAEVVFASRAADALARALEVSPALILLDVLLPDGNGYELCRALKSHAATRDVPIVFVTNLGAEGQEAEGLLSGAIDYLTKPINAAILAARVRNHLALKRQHDALESASLRDEVTRLPNRLRFEEALDMEWRRARRARGPLSLVVAEVVGFAAFARRFGPLALNDGLARVAAALAAVPRRPGDLVARLDQDQFVALLPDTDERGAAFMAERMARHVSALALHGGAQGEESLRIETAVVTVFPPSGGRPEELLGPAQVKLKSRRERALAAPAPAAQPPAPPAPDASTDVAPRAAAKIFIVDDDPVSSETLAEVVRGRGHEVESCLDPREALARVERALPDVIMLDVRMPELDGFAVCRALKLSAAAAAIPVIFLSVVEDGEAKVRAFDAGGADYVCKPYEPREVLARIAHQVELARLHREMRAAHLQLVDLDRMKSTFAAMLVHDLRSPLGVVQMTMAMLGSRLAPSEDKDLNELVNLSRRGLDNTLGLIADMLEVYRSDPQRDVVARDEIDLRALVEETVADARLEGERRGLSVTALVPPALIISGDRKRLRRALANLLGNALKFTPNGGQITCELRLGESPSGPRALLDVRDTGEGIPASELPFIFDIYRQAESRARGTGVGLGLSIVKRIIEAHGGSVSVRSAVGLGTSFTLELPMSRDGAR